MTLQSSLRKFISRASVVALVTSAFTLIATPAQATAGYEPSEYFFTRTSTDGHSLVVKPGEYVDFASRYELSGEYSGWPASSGTKFTRTALTPKAASIANLSVYGDGYRQWNGYGEGCDGASSDTANLVIDASSSCIDWLDVTDRFQGLNETASNITINTNANAQVTKRGKKDITDVAGAQSSVFGNMQVDSGASYTIGANEDFVAAHFRLCINEDLVSEGDILTISATMSHAGTPIASDNLDISDWNDTDGDVMTYTVPEGNPYDQVVTIDVSPSTTTAGEYTATADVKDGATSKLEPCPDYTVAEWPGVTTIDGSAGTPDATTETKSMPTQTYTANDEWYDYGMYHDGFGGVFHYGFVTGTSDVQMVNMSSSSANNSFAGTGKALIARDATDDFDFQRYGAAGANTFSLRRLAKGKWSLTTGTLNSATTTAVTIPAAKIDALCPSKWTFGRFFEIAAPTSAPVAMGYCIKGSNMKWFLTKFVGTTPSSIANLGNPAGANPCGVFSIGVDAGATGTETAIIAYTRTSSRDEEGMCTTVGATTASRALVNVTAATAATTTPIVGDPWGAAGEPITLEFAPGSTPNTWIGLAFDMEAVMAPATPTTLFTVASNAITTKADITLDDSTDFGSSVEIAPTLQVSGTKWVLRISSSQQIDGEEVQRATVATVNPNTGTVTNGDVLEMSGFGLAKSRTRGTFATDASGVSRYFQITSDTQYKVTTWTLP